MLFFFGATKGGGVQDNLDRWYGQFSQPDGRASRDAATLTIKTVGTLRVTAVDLPGTYLGSRMGPGEAPAPRTGWRMLAAIVHAPQGLVFFKLIGPETVVQRAEPAFEALVSSFEAAR